MIRRGFTLIELLVVITIIAILASVGLAVYTNAQKNALDASYKGQVREYQAAMEQCYAAQVGANVGTYTGCPGTFFPEALPATYSTSLVAASAGYCVMSPALKTTTAGNCSACAGGVATFAASSTNFCAKNLQ